MRRLRPPVGGVLREQAVGFVAGAAAPEQQPVAAVALADVTPPRQAGGEAAVAGALSERGRYQHLPALGAQGPGQGGQELRHQRVGRYAQVGGTHAAARSAHQVGAAGG